MKRNKTQKGISLIAFILIIVVLILLAGGAILLIKNYGAEGYIQTGTTITKADQTIKVGQYITNYNSGVAGYNGKWQILGAENGQLLLVSEVINDDTTSKFLGKDGYTSVVNTLNENCSKYANKDFYATSARSINVEDVNKIMGYVPKKDNNVVTYTRNDDGNIVATVNGTTYEWEDSELVYFETINGEVLGENTNNVTGENTVYEYEISTNSLDNLAYSMLLPSQSISEQYWLATTNVYADKDELSYGVYYLSMPSLVKSSRLSSVNLYSAKSALSIPYTLKYRAVVYLDSDVTLTSVDENSYTIN